MRACVCACSNPTIEVVKFRLRGWCILGAFLLPAFTILGHECQDLLSPCDGSWNACVPRFILSSERKGKIPSIGSSGEDRTRDCASGRTASPTHCRLSCFGHHKETTKQSRDSARAPATFSSSSCSLPLTSRPSADTLWQVGIRCRNSLRVSSPLCVAHLGFGCSRTAQRRGSLRVWCSLWWQAHCAARLALNFYFRIKNSFIFFK